MEHPEIDVALFENPYGKHTHSLTFSVDPNDDTIPLDLELMKENVKYAKVLGENEPWKSLVIREVDPGKEHSTDEEIKGQLIVSVS